MKRTHVLTRSRFVFAVGAATALGAAGCANPCRDDGNTAICGDFGDLAFAVTPDEPLRWPAVTTERGSILVSSNSRLLEVTGRGEIQVVQAFSGGAENLQPSASAPSVGEDGTAFVVVGGGDVGAYSDSGTLARWNANVGGRSTASPPAVGIDVVHVTTTNEDGSERTLTTLELGTGEVVSQRPGASSPVAADDDGVIYLSDTSDCGASFSEIVVEDPTGAVRFRHREDSLIRDFSPGPDGEIYLVNGDRELVRLSSDGSREWTFTPSCVQCTVAGAPTVTDDMIYFPVWQGSPANEGCGDPDPNVVEPDVEATDPLYALTRDGDLKWSYDGFTTLAERYQGGGGAMGMLGLSFSPRVHHHPSGRPIIADDGTLYVPADGAIVALDADGTELGYAVMNPQSGEQRTGDGTMGSRNTPGFSAAPTLAEDGKLYVYDGAQVRAFETRKKPAQIPWTAPFGGNRNASRLSR